MSLGSRPSGFPKFLSFDCNAPNRNSPAVSLNPARAGQKAQASNDQDFLCFFQTVFKSRMLAAVLHIENYITSFLSFTNAVAKFVWRNYKEDFPCRLAMCLNFYIRKVFS